MYSELSHSYVLNFSRLDFKYLWGMVAIATTCKKKKKEKKEQTMNITKGYSKWYSN